MTNNRLILRNLNSPWVVPTTDITKNSVLSWADLDNNFIYLKGELINSSELDGDELILNKINGNNINVDLSDLVTPLNNNINYISGQTVTSISFDQKNYDLSIVSNNGVLDTINLGILSQDIFVTGGTYDNSSGVITFNKNNGDSFDIPGFIVGFTDFYTTGVTLNGTLLEFDRTDLANAYSVDISNLGWTGGTNYILVKAEGTDIENGAELQAAYDLATSLSATSINRITIVAAPGHYKLPKTLVMDNDFVDLVSLTGEPDVVLDLTDDNFFTGEVDLTAFGGPVLNVVNDPFVVNDLMTFDFNSNPALSLEADCKIVGIKTAKHESDTFEALVAIQGNNPYFLAVGNDYLLPINQVDGVSPIVKNVEAGVSSFGVDNTLSLTTTINGYFENVSFGIGSLQGVSVNATMINCKGYFSLLNSEYYGRFANVVLDGRGFSGYDLTGQFVNCVVTDSLLTGDVAGFNPNPDDGDLYGYFENCKIQGGGFATNNDTKIKSTAYLKNCEVFSNNRSFGVRGIEDGAILENCVGGNDSFCQGGDMEGKLIRCRKTSGFFPTPVGNGKIILCIDGNDDIVNQTAS